MSPVHFVRRTRQWPYEGWDGVVGEESLQGNARAGGVGNKVAETVCRVLAFPTW